ncbi:MAG TPA: hypothetical protein VFY52_05445 [Thermoleophilaceae bacterium]|nr:hypothetical protein [Thermoleophilaceae bacterium]
MSEELPEVDQVLLSTAISLVNLAGIRLTEKDHKDVQQARQAIDAARELLPLCPQDEIGPIKDALSQLQMLYVKETGSRAQPAEPGASPTADERAKARSKIWTPPGT